MFFLAMMDQTSFWMLGVIALLLLLGVVCLLVVLLQSQRRAQSLQNESILLSAKNEELVRTNQTKENSLTETKREVTILQEKISTAQVVQQKLTSQLEARDEQISLLNETLEKLEVQAETLQAQVERYRAKIEEQDKTLQIEQNHLETERNYLRRLKEDFNVQTKALKDEFKVLSAGILKERQQEFDTSSAKGLDAVINPLKEVLGSFRKRVDEVHTEQTKGQGNLENELKNLKNMNTQLSERAENLTSALRNDKKTMGNWGEVQLERLLENAGLDQNCFRREANYKTEDGANQRPDFIIDLPEDKCLIVDSKVSLNAYVDSVNATSEEEAVAHLKQHTTNVRNHIKNLAEKSYDSLQLLNTPDFVFMFMPNEPAYLAAFEEDASLFDFAYDKKIAVVTPNTLLPILRTVSSLWRIETQNKSTADLAYSAEKVHKKLVTFLDKFERVGAQLATVQNSYSEAQKTLSGRGSLLGLVKEFEDKGVKVTKALPQASELD